MIAQGPWQTSLSIQDARELAFRAPSIVIASKSTPGVYSLVQWNRFSDVTGCMKFRCIQGRQRSNFTVPSCRCLPWDFPSETIWALWGGGNIVRAVTVSLRGTLVSTWVLFRSGLSRASAPVHRQTLAFGQRRRRNRRIGRRRFEGGRREGASRKEEESSKEPVYCSSLIRG